MKTSMMLAAACVLLACTPCAAFKLQLIDRDRPADVPPGQAQAFVERFMSGVHERITERAYLRAGITEVPRDVIFGVRWNDNPPSIPSELRGPMRRCNGRQIRLEGGLSCWGPIMAFDALSGATFDLRRNSLAPSRSHFGDMQFLHAMAGKEKDSPEITRRQILHWAEFAYGVATGRVKPGDNVFGLKDTGLALSPGTRTWISALYDSPTKRKWAVRDIFAPGQVNLRLMAFGSLLHVIEDSYAPGHVVRDSRRVDRHCFSYDSDSPVVQFLTYVGQDGDRHGHCDEEPDWLDDRQDDPRNPLTVIAEIILIYERDDEGTAWPKVEAVLTGKVFKFAGATKLAAPGDCFESEAYISERYPYEDRTLHLGGQCP
jgi:hypothetical protein